MPCIAAATGRVKSEFKLGQIRSNPLSPSAVFFLRVVSTCLNLFRRLGHDGSKIETISYERQTHQLRKPVHTPRKSLMNRCGFKALSFIAAIPERLGLYPGRKRNRSGDPAHRRGRSANFLATACSISCCAMTQP